MTAGAREFQVADTVWLKNRLPMSACLNGTSRNGTADDRSNRVPLRALMCRLRYTGADICHILNLVGDAAPPATNAVPSAAVHMIVLSLDERFLRHYSVPATACGE